MHPKICEAFGLKLVRRLRPHELHRVPPVPLEVLDAPNEVELQRRAVAVRAAEEVHLRAHVLAAS
eukprot:CAMPEP_0114272896 /NCGR_PEP_ID=MMETSP0058-20121206/28766_1 /TAXON_ID=36894 /ORGANISM="Pyramimonas parkeae, CCMP726" /LENGTH=64 /DNA_ID=CAMNT_0001392231 /DNA_START=203 /DNA_END=397 /DNA_ORIENTATION=+